METLREVLDAFHEGGGEGKPAYVQIHVSYAATDDEARADNAAWVAEYLDEPPTTAVVEAVLRAAGA